ncbi:uncharacterized protein [Solanum lycopersicum]|uniref:uncharacterized protein n=1 Tax=Solanum lycopersicum TaxID=4081 RepID=UPI00374A80A8
MRLSEFDIVYVTQKAIKVHALADHLAENPVDKGLFIEEAASHLGKGIRAVLVSESGQHYPMASKLRFNCTNNMAECEACIPCFKMAINMNVYELLVIGYSKLLNHQVQGDWAVKNPKIIHYIQYEQNLCKRFHTEFKEHPLHCSHVKTEPDGLPWYFDIKNYLEFGTYPEDDTANKNKSIHRLKKDIKSILRKMIDKHRGWHEMLPYDLLGYHMTIRTSIGAPIYLLVYGTEAVIPDEVEIPSLRIIQEAELTNVEWVNKRIDQLTFID